MQSSKVERLIRYVTSEVKSFVQFLLRSKSLWAEKENPTFDGVIISIFGRFQRRKRCNWSPQTVISLFESPCLRKRRLRRRSRWPATWAPWRVKNVKQYSLNQQTWPESLGSSRPKIFKAASGRCRISYSTRAPTALIMCCSSTLRSISFRVRLRLNLTVFDFEVTEFWVRFECHSRLCVNLFAVAQPSSHHMDFIVRSKLKWIRTVFVIDIHNFEHPVFIFSFLYQNSYTSYSFRQNVIQIVTNTHPLVLPSMGNSTTPVFLQRTFLKLW